MQSYTLDGIIVTESIPKDTIESGTIGLILLHDRYYRITVVKVHKNGELTVDGDYVGIINKDRYIYRIVVQTTKGTIPVQIKDWAKLIENNSIGKKESFKIVSYPFTKGQSSKNCHHCGHYFLADQKQPYCKSCCENELSIAKL